MSAQTQSHPAEHPAFCERNHVPGAQHASAIDGTGWCIDVLGESKDWAAGLQVMTDATLPAFDAIALATSLITVADVMTGVMPERGVVHGTANRSDVVMIPDAWIDKRNGVMQGDRVDLDIYTPEAAYARGADLLAMAGGKWDWEHYSRDAGPCLALRDLLPERGYGAWVGDGLSDATQRRLESRARARVQRLTVTGAHWPAILWGSATGDPIGAAVGQVPWTWREDWGHTPLDVAPGALDGLTAAQIDAVTETVRTMFISAPRALPPSWAVGEPDLEGNRLSAPVVVQHATRHEVRPILVRAWWCQVAPSKSLVAVDTTALSASADGQLWLDRGEARALIAAIASQVDMIESETKR